RTVAENSSVLLKNTVIGVSARNGEANDAGLANSAVSPVLPLAAGTRVALFDDMATTPRFQASGSSKVNATPEENTLD
ncbi:hypothetical protein, partial [Bifidobacterium breve]|uniref:hypothetical protein n=1 Tax=Bifidobacterium breve TaxID=1685 RepID=UPI0029D71BA1|nr:hypothetical protein [Bifidobacterium breve]